MLVDARGALRVTDQGELRVKEEFDFASSSATEFCVREFAISAGTTEVIDEADGATFLMLKSDVAVTVRIGEETEGHDMTLLIAAGDFTNGITITATDAATVTLIFAL